MLIDKTRAQGELTYRRDHDRQVLKHRKRAQVCVLQHRARVWAPQPDASRRDGRVGPLGGGREHDVDVRVNLLRKLLERGERNFPFKVPSLRPQSTSRQT